MILYIVPKVVHRSGKEMRLIAWWHRDRLIIKDMDAEAYEGLHYFPTECMGASTNERPIIDLITLRADGQGWDVEGETADGKKFLIEVKHDFVEKHIAYFNGPIYQVP